MRAQKGAESREAWGEKQRGPGSLPCRVGGGGGGLPRRGRFQNEPLLPGEAAGSTGSCCLGPHHYLFGCPQYLADFEDGVNLTGPGEEWPEGVHLRHDAAHGPDVDRRAVAGGPQEHLRSPVPAGRRS